ncbi:MAG: hypothetical protein DME34_11420 [Verrucomicrobia bacterium]|nr:MAG: hypothetical protein DME34_11420 [Verrucomicrobiota bacterium]
MPNPSFGDEVEQTDDQVVGMTRGRGQRFFVHDFEVDQPRTIGLGIVNHVLHGGVGVRPRPAELAAPELVRAPKFPRRRLHHRARQRALDHVVPKTATGDFLHANGMIADGERAEGVAIEQAIALNLPLLPFFDLTAETNGDAGEAEKQVCRVSDLFAAGIARFDDHRFAAAKFLRHRVHLQEIDRRGGKIAECSRGDPINQCRGHWLTNSFFLIRVAFCDGCMASPIPLRN